MISETIYLTQNPIGNAVAASAVTTLCIWIFAKFLQKWNVFKSKPLKVPNYQKSTRKYGGRVSSLVSQTYDRVLSIALDVEWTPSNFKRPTASPYPNWDVHTTKPIPYRPFRYGP